MDMAGGIELERSYPYHGTDGRCEFSRGDVAVTIEGSRRISGESGMLTQMQSSPLSVCVDASEWSSYSGGVVGEGCGRSIDHRAYVLNIAMKTIRSKTGSHERQDRRTGSL